MLEKVPHAVGAFALSVSLCLPGCLGLDGSGCKWSAACEGQYPTPIEEKTEDEKK